MALTIVYMLFFDFPIGVLPATLQQAERRVPGPRALGAVGEREAAIGAAGLALALVSAAWLAVAALRIRRLEA